LDISTWRNQNGTLVARLSSLRELGWFRWLASFLILFALGALWAFGNPLTATPDEPAHVVRAAAVSRGELSGRPLTGSQRAALPTTVGIGSSEGGSPSIYRTVSVPEIYGRANWGCLVHHPEETAACITFTGPQREARVVTHTTAYPPAYYAWVGIPSRLGSAGPRAVYVMRLAAVALAAALLASAVMSLQRVGDTPFVMLGVLVAVTPTALFLAASVNPNGVEIAAGLAVWVSGAVLVIEARSSVDGAPDRRLVARLGIATAVLVLSRQLGPIWAGLILLVLAGLAGKQGVRALRASRALWAWGAVVGVCLIAQMAWLVWADALDAHSYIGGPSHETGVELVRRGIGQSSMFYRQMIGDFGWNEVLAPAFTLLVWTAVLGGLVALAFVFGRRREVVALAVVGILSAVLPVAFIVYQTGYSGWLGRYAMPFAVGIPVLAGIALRGPALGRARGTAVMLAGAGLAAGHVLAYGQNLGRNTVLADGTIWFWTKATWSPPGSPLVLMIAFTVATMAWVAWLVVPMSGARHGPQLEAEAADLDVPEVRVGPGGVTQRDR